MAANQNIASQLCMGTNTQGAGRVFIIAEAGVNHNGSVDLALSLVDAAAEAGADAVKFQTFRADKLASVQAPKARYQEGTTATQESQFNMLRRLELDEPAHVTLIERCRQRGIRFLSTPFDIDSLHFLCERLDLPVLKLASGEITNAPLLLAAARSGRPIILSTGMSDLGDIERALGVLAFGYTCVDAPPSRAAFESAYRSDAGRLALIERVILLHCTSEYPAPFGEVNLRAMQTLRVAFGLRTGLSDHTEGIAISVAAAALGAEVIEKHLTLDRSLPGPDHRASLDPAIFSAMVTSIRQVETALGNGVKVASTSELDNSVVVRKSLITARSMRKGERLDASSLTVKRPGNGISPFYYWDYLDTPASRDYGADEPLDDK